MAGGARLRRAGEPGGPRPGDRSCAEALRSLALANHDDAAAPAAEEVLDRVALEVAPRAGLTPRFGAGGDRLEVAAGGPDAALALVLGIVFGARANGSWRRMKACPHEHCGWVFYDRSRNRSSQWCSMRICGNRTKAARHRASWRGRRARAGRRSPHRPSHRDHTRRPDVAMRRVRDDRPPHPCDPTARPGRRRPAAARRARRACGWPTGRGPRSTWFATTGRRTRRARRLLRATRRRSRRGASARGFAEALDRRVLRAREPATPLGELWRRAASAALAGRSPTPCERRARLRARGRRHRRRSPARPELPAHAARRPAPGRATARPRRRAVHRRRRSRASRAGARPSSTPDITAGRYPRAALGSAAAAGCSPWPPTAARDDDAGPHARRARRGARRPRRDPRAQPRRRRLDARSSAPAAAQPAARGRTGSRSPAAGRSRPRCCSAALSAAPRAVHRPVTSRVQRMRCACSTPSCSSPAAAPPTWPAPSPRSCPPTAGTSRSSPGSLGGRGACDAERFYAGLDVHAVDFAAGDAPMHPSYEDRPDAPDRVFAAVDDDEYERHVAAWARALERGGRRRARRAPPPPPHAGARGRGARRARRAGRRAPPRHRAAHARADRRRPAADVDARRGVGAADAALGAPRRPPARPLAEPDPARRGAARPRRRPLRRGPERLRPRALRAAAGRPRGATGTSTSSPHPHGWRPGEDEGSVRYTEAEIAPLDDGDPVVLAVGRFTAVKRTGLLVRAFAARAAATPVRASLVLLGGHPGEWEGEHPLRGDRRERRARRLPRRLARARHAARPSSPPPTSIVARLGPRAVRPRARRGDGVRAAGGRGRPLRARRRSSRTGGPGWLVEPDDESALARALVPGDRRARASGRAAAPRPRDGARPLVVAGARRRASPTCSARSRAPRSRRDRDS